MIRLLLNKKVDDEKNTMVYLFLLVYSVFSKLFHSLASPIFPINTFQVDNCAFYTLGKGILEGKVLYKDLIDNKMPYAYFINALANIFGKNHFGLYMVEVIFLFVSLVFTYKLLKVLLQNNYFAIIGTVLFSLLLNDVFLNDGMSKLECYEIPFIMISIYLSCKFFIEYNGEKFSLKYSFVSGLIVGLCVMINAKSIFNFAPLYLAIIVRLLIDKKTIDCIKVICFGLLGVVLVIMPYAIYVLVTDSIKDAYYAIFILPFEYIMKDGSIFYNTNNIFESVVKYISFYQSFFIFVTIAFIIVLVFEKNVFVKIMYIVSVLLTIWYTVKPNNPFKYYLMMFIPYLIPIYVFVAKFLIKLFEKNHLKISNILKIVLTICCIFVAAVINFPLGYNDIKKQYPAYVHIYTMIKDSVDKKFNDLSDKKILALGYIPEVYVALDVVPKFPYYIVMCNSYVGAKKFVDKHYEYVKNAEPDIIITNTKDSFYSFTKEIKDNTMKALDENYIKHEVLDTHTTSGIYEVYIKK